MMRVPSWLGFGLLAVLVASSADADSVQGTRSELLRETAHEIRMTLGPSHATLRVRRTVFNGGRRHDQAEFFIDVPQSAVATGLGSLGSRQGRPFWFLGELMEAEAAAAKYRELTGYGAYAPKDPAILWWRNQAELVLQVFPCAPVAPKQVEYTLEMPTRYAAGRYFVELPPIGSESLRATLSAFPEHPGDRLFVDGEPRAPGSTLSLAAEGGVRVELERKVAPRFEGELVSLEFGSERVLTEYRVAAAPRLSSIPKRARVVVLLDGSHSLSSPARIGSVPAARAYLSHFTDALVEVVTFDRKVHARHGRLVPVAAAAKDLQTLQVVPQNGSHLDRALVYADTLLAREPADVPKRILVLTDALVRSTLTPETLAAAVERSRALVHVGVVHGGGDSLERDDEHPWSSVTRPTGGLVWRASVSGGGDPVVQAGVFEEWVRPVALDHVSLSPTSEALDVAVPIDGDETNMTRLREGEARSLLGIAPHMTAALTLRGDLWTERVDVSFQPDEKAARRWAAFVFGTELLHGLRDDEMMVLARHGGAVSPVTSYLAIEPGVRPSTEGLGEGGGGRGEGIGLGSIGTLGYGSAFTDSVNRQEFLEELVRRELVSCGASERRVTVEIETTLREIVEVSRVELGGTRDSSIEACLREGVWSFALPGAFTDERATWTVRV